MNVGKLYKYLFYKIYRFAESMAAPWCSDSKAFIAIIVLCGYTIFALGGYFRLCCRDFDPFPNKFVVILIILIISGFNYYIFYYKDKWKKIVQDFDKLSKRKNKIGSWLVFLFIILLLANFLFSMYLGSTVDWSQYRQFYSGGFDGFITDGSAAQALEDRDRMVKENQKIVPGFKLMPKPAW